MRTRRGQAVRPLALVLLVALSASARGALAGPAATEVRHVAVVHSAPGDDFKGPLEIVRSDGRGDRVPVGNDFLAADLGPDGSLFGVQDRGEGGALVRSDVRGTPVEVLADASDRSFHLAAVASSTGSVAVLRYVSTKPKPPRFLRQAIRTLRRTEVPVLVPARRPRGTTGLVTEGDPARYQVRFTNDPDNRLPHIEQVNRFVTGTLSDEPPPPDARPVEVRGTQGQFFCGASTCFLTWRENGASYMVGEFGSPDQAVPFAEDLVSLEDLLGPFWKLGEPVQVPRLFVRGPDGVETPLQTVTGFCECTVIPFDWSPDGRRLLVGITEGPRSRLLEYRTASSKPPRQVREERREVILDAAYGPEGELVVIGDAESRTGRLVTDAGRRLAENVRSIDAQGPLLAYVRGDRAVVRDLRTGAQRVIARRALAVSVGMERLRGGNTPGPAASPASRGDNGEPVGLLVGGGVAALALIALVLVWRRLQGR